MAAILLGDARDALFSRSDLCGIFSRFPVKIKNAPILSTRLGVYPLYEVVHSSYNWALIFIFDLIDN